MPLHCRGLCTVVDVYQNIAPYPIVTHEFGVVAETAPPLPVAVSDEDRLDEEAQREELWCMGIAEQKFESALVIWRMVQGEGVRCGAKADNGLSRRYHWQHLPLIGAVSCKQCTPSSKRRSNN
jgi:hypothetical protein